MLTPATALECAELLPRAGRVAFAGGGTEATLGRAARDIETVVSSAGLGRIVEYAPGDMVITVEAGVTLATVQAAARAHGQRLALDPPHPERATMGGLVATGAFGPRRAAHGAVRDLILGVTLVLADGTVARGGGKVVKNVAGFDLPRLACGSLGTLAMIAGATFRLHPLPEAEATVVARGLGAAEVVAQTARLRDLQLEPTSVVAVRAGAGYDLGVRFEGFGPGVREQVARLGAPFAPDDGGFWPRHDAVRAGGPMRVRASAAPSRFAIVAPLLEVWGEVAWYASLGIGFAAGAPADVAAARAGCASVVVETDHDDPWGPPPPAFALMRELKRRFDPEGRLNPGRFVGGL